MGGGGGGALGEAPAPVENAAAIGGGGGGGAEGAPVVEKDGVGGEATNGDSGRSALAVGVVGDFLSSMAERGRGGAMVPKSMDASCFALPPVGRPFSSSESEESSVESTTDHSSSSGRTRDRRDPVGVDERCGRDLETLSCWVRRWKGLVDTSFVLDVPMDE